MTQQFSKTIFLNPTLHLPPIFFNNQQSPAVAAAAAALSVPVAPVATTPVKAANRVVIEIDCDENPKQRLCVTIPDCLKDRVAPEGTAEALVCVLCLDHLKCVSFQPCGQVLACLQCAKAFF